MIRAAAAAGKRSPPTQSVVPRRRRCRLLPVLLLLALGLTPAAAEAQNAARDSWQRVPDVLAALSVGAGSRVADVGAGSGYFTLHLSREVGLGGRVFAVEISERALGQLAQLVEREGLANVEIVQGEVDDPGLAERSLDAVLVVDAYHEMTEYASMLAGMYRSLRPGGRLVILDLVPPDSSAARGRQTANHRLALSLVEREIRAAGFEIIDSDPRFTRSGRGSGQWMLVARRPARSRSYPK